MDDNYPKPSSNSTDFCKTALALFLRGSALLQEGIPKAAPVMISKGPFSNKFCCYQLGELIRGGGGGLPPKWSTTHP